MSRAAGGRADRPVTAQQGLTIDQTGRGLRKLGDGLGTHPVSYGATRLHFMQVHVCRVEGVSGPNDGGLRYCE